MEKNRRILRMAAAETNVGLEEAQIRQKIAEGTFPKPIKLSPSGRAIVDPNIWDDVERLREWTIDQLHRVDLIEFPEDYNYPIDRSDRRAFLLQCIIFDREGDKQIEDALRRCKRSNSDSYYQLIAADPALRGWLQSGPGRRKGHAPGMEEALGEITRIRLLWRQAFGKVYKKGETFSLAFEIAAERYALTPRELDDYRKNRTPSQRI